MKRFPRWSLVLPLLLMPLIGVLAFLQYRWINEATLQESRRLQETLEVSGNALREDLTTEIQAMDAELSMSSEVFERRDWPTYADQVRRFRATARLRALPRAIYFIEGGEGASMAWKLDEAKGTFVKALPLPETLGVGPGVLESLLELPNQEGATFYRSFPLFPKSYFQKAIPNKFGAQSFKFMNVAPPSRLVMELDAGVFLDAFVLASVQRHFRPFLGEFTLTVLSAKGGTLRTLGASGDLTSEKAVDYSLPLLFPLQLGRIFHESYPLPSGGAPRGITMFSEKRISKGAPMSPALLTLQVMHRQGSSKKAMEQIRYRNLGISFGILAVMALSLAILVDATRRAQRLAMQEREFVASVSHELKTPLAVLLSAGENLAAGIVTESSNVKRYGEAIQAEGSRLREMIDKILGFSRLEAERRVHALEPVDPESILDKVLLRLAPMAEQSGASFQRSPSQGNARIQGRPADLGSILENLLGNAIKHGMPEGRSSAEGWTIEIATSLEKKRPGEYWVCRVKDAGPGVPRRERYRIFAPFNRGARAMEDQTPGSGLGLAIARNHARALGGDVDLERTGEVGACFAVILPLARIEECS